MMAPVVNTPNKTNYSDPVFTVSSSKEYYKTVCESMKYSTEYVMQPNFSSMFSEIQHYPNSSLILKSAYPLPHFIDASYKGKSRAMARSNQTGRVEVDGADRFRYFRKPCGSGKEIVPKKASLQYKLLLTDYVDPGTELMKSKTVAADSRRSSAASSKPASASKEVAKGTQTDYREAEVQTIPWAPPYVFQGSVTPEILTLAHLSWGEGLPAGIHEVELIERARIKREWEQILLNHYKTPQDFESRKKCITDIETNEWMFREQDIEKINSFRMELASKSMKDHKHDQFNRLDGRINRQIERKVLEKNKQLKNLQEKKQRELRKLTAKHKRWENKLNKVPESKESTDLSLIVGGGDPTKAKKSRIFTPKHEIIKYDRLMFGTVEGLILMENAPSDPIPAFNFVKASKPKLQVGMCHKIWRWSTDEDLKQLQIDLRKKLDVLDETTNTFTRREKEKPLPPPLLCIEIPLNQYFELNKATVLIQQLLKGRAVQYTVFQDRKRFQPLIEELKETHSLDKEENYSISEKKYETLSLIRKQFIYKQLEGKQDQIVNHLNGEVAAEVMDFLAKELQRLEAEKKVHAFAMLAERERWQREAYESGRRQKEDFFRKQHDEMFKQVMNIRNKSVELYLEDTLVESFNWLAEDEARHYVRRVAQKVDKAAHQAQARKNAIEQEEMVTDLVFNYLLPDVNKSLARHKLRENQKRYLQMADDFLESKLACTVSEGATQVLEMLTEDEHSENLDESDSSLELEDEEPPSNETSTEILDTDVLKTHCLPQTKSEEETYNLDLKNEINALQRSRLFRLAEIVKEEFLDTLIADAEEMAQQMLQLESDNLSTDSRRGTDGFLVFNKSKFETVKRRKMCHLMVLSEILNDDFLKNLIDIAEGEVSRDMASQTSFDTILTNKSDTIKRMT